MYSGVCVVLHSGSFYPCFWSAPILTRIKSIYSPLYLQGPHKQVSAFPVTSLVPGGMRVLFAHRAFAWAAHAAWRALFQSLLDCFFSFQISALNSAPGKPFLDALSKSNSPLWFWYLVSFRKQSSTSGLQLSLHYMLAKLFHLFLCFMFLI